MKNIIKKIRKILRYVVRKALNIREHETIFDGLSRKKYKFLKKINKKTIYKKDIMNSIKKLGLKKGDTVIVHAAYRAFIGYKGKPEEIVDGILDIVGEKGNVIMPAYTENKDYFDYYEKTSAGCLAEIFRKKEKNIRSLNAIFSMSAIGPKAEYYMNDHINSIYHFDEHSPYYKAVKDNAKILFLGLGKKPNKITLFHLVTYKLRNELKCYKNVYENEIEKVLIDKNGKKITKKIKDRYPKIQNNKTKYSRLYQKIKKKNDHIRLNFLDIHLFESKIIYERAYKYVKENEYNLYKKVRV